MNLYAIAIASASAGDQMQMKISETVAERSEESAHANHKPQS